MSTFFKGRLLESTTTIGLVLAALVLMLFAYGSASAAIDECRGDPVLVLSNGKTMTIAAVIGTSVSDVKEVEYVVHVPRGVKLVRVEWTGDPALVAKEELEFHDDAKPGQYTSDTVVETKTKQVAVTVTTWLGSLSKTITGVSGRHLTVTLHAP